MSGRIQFSGYLIVVIVAATAGETFAQVNGFLSGSYGYHNNPLYNYEAIGDQITQGYVELNYEPGPLSVAYLGGLMMFNGFTDRNYYEHTGRIGYHQAFSGLKAPGRAEDGDGEEGGDDEGAEDRDSLKSYLDLSLRLAARHDKTAYQEFDNTGTGLTGSYRFNVGSVFIRLHNDCSYRSYAYIEELSNVSDVLSFQIGRYSAHGPSFGIIGQAGLKYFTTDQFDTTRFESTRTYVEKGNGKGKAGAKLMVPSEKSILVNSSTTTVSQIGGGMFAGVTWTSGALNGEVLYRRSIGAGSRYLAQYANTSMLNEDIYNDFFSYDGPSSRLSLRQSLPLGLRATVNVEWLRKRFSAPALNLNGDTIAENRVDMHSAVDLWLSRYFELGRGIGLEVALSIAGARNQSNDDYNDYSINQAGVTLGVGF
jgi:hypothetical protein